MEQELQVGNSIKVTNFSPSFDGCKGKIIERDGDYLYADIEVEGDVLRIELYEYEVELDND